MSKDKPRLTRLTAIMTQLQSKRLVTARDIAEKHGVSIRTVYRDIRTLEQSGIPIQTEEGKGYSIMEGYRLPPIMFSEEEANALITAEQIINQNKDKSLVDQYSSAIEKIKSVLRYSQKDKTELLSERLEIRNNLQQTTTSNYLIQLQKAITNYQIVKIEYFSLQKKATSRSIEPFALIHTQENWVMIAFCLLRKDFRAFRLDCIQHLSVQKQTFKRHNLTLEQFYKSMYQKMKTPPDIPLTQEGGNFASNQKTKAMQKVKVESFKVIGISVRTSNNEGQAKQDIGMLWNKWMSENLMEKIPNRLGQEVFSVYTNYEGDHTKPYDTILGCKVESLDTIPDGMVGKEVEGGTYAKFLAKGDLTGEAIINTWHKIWNTDVDRTYTSDFEQYGEKSMNPKDGEADILVAIKS